MAFERDRPQTPWQPGLNQGDFNDPKIDQIFLEKTEAVILSTADLKLASVVRNATRIAGKPLIISTPRNLSTVLGMIAGPHKERYVRSNFTSSRHFELIGVTSTCVNIADYRLVFTTSGTTGVPKLVPFRDEQVNFTTLAIDERLNYSSQDIIGCGLYPSFDYAFYQSELAAQSGSSIVQFDGIRFPIDAIKALSEFSISILPVTPGYARKLTDIACRLDKIFPTVRLVTNTGGKLNRDLRDRLHRVFPNADIRPMYGLTECKRVSVSPSTIVGCSSDHSGIPLSGTQVSVRSETGAVLTQGSVGEFYVEGPHVTDGYIGGTPFHGVLKTGDMGFLDKKGRINNLGRISHDQVKINDQRISVFDIVSVVREFIPAGSLLHIESMSDPDGNAKSIDVFVEFSVVSTLAVKKEIRNRLGSLVERILDLHTNVDLRLNESGKVYRVRK